MQFGLIPINIGMRSPGSIVGIAQLAESCGFESVWTAEHVMVPVTYASKYPYNDKGKMDANPETNMVDPLVALSLVAGATKTLKLGTGVNILPQVSPLLLAKQAASVDFVSGGRLLLGLGIGWLQEEYIAMGAPFEKRGARFDDYVAAMKKVWSGDTVDHNSEFLTWKGFKSHPTPAQRPHMPIIIGGNAGKVFERVAKLGDGWMAPPMDNPDDLGPRLKTLRETCERLGRDYEDLEITAMWDASAGIDGATRLRDMGVSRFVSPINTLGQARARESIEQFGEAVISKFR